MTLSELLKNALGQSDVLLPELEVKGIAQDSRRVKPGFVFVARRGEFVNGHSFVEQARQQGAIAVVGEATGLELRAFPWHGHIPYIQVRNDKIALAKLAASFYNHPSRALFTIGVTGTDGKTTTAFLLHHLLLKHYPSGLISTAGIKLAQSTLALEGHFTTPEAPEIQGFLAQFRDQGLSHAVIESSSHGFAQHRLDEVDYDLAVWTNLSPEHLDYHGSLKAYREAKLTLVRRAGLSILNADDPAFAHFAAASEQVISYGIDSPNADWRATDIRQETGRLSWTLHVKTGSVSKSSVTLPMIGAYNVYNALAALAAAHASGLELEVLLASLADFSGVPGRMQLLQSEPFAVVVDFAHTAPALAKALAALRPQANRRIILVVGAAGERDPGKRAPIGQTATQYADFSIFTEEDHRSEDLNAILAQLAAGAQESGGRKGLSYVLEPDRRKAIRKAIAMAQTGDLVLLVGKGHEQTLERGYETLAWDEVAEAQQALKQR